MRSYPVLPGQRGLATSAQLKAHGWTKSSLAHLVRVRGALVLPGVYRLDRRPLTFEDAVCAAQLWAGLGGLLTGLPGLAVRGIEVPAATRLRFLVPLGTHVRAAQFADPLLPHPALVRTTRFHGRGLPAASA